jgi:hypothetical protein
MAHLDLRTGDEKSMTGWGEWGWVYFIYGMIAWQIGKMILEAARQEIHEHREKRFLKFVDITFENKERIHYISLSTSDRKAMQDITRQIQEEFDVSDEDIEKLLKGR